MNTILGKEIKDRFRIEIVSRAYQDIDFEFDDEFNLIGELSYCNSSFEETIGISIFDKVLDNYTDIDVEELGGVGYSDKHYLTKALNKVIENLGLIKPSKIKLNESLSFSSICPNDCESVIVVKDSFGKYNERPSYCPCCGTKLVTSQRVEILNK